MRLCVLTIVALGLTAAHGWGQEFTVGGHSFGISEPLYAYDDLDVWKHGWIQVTPHYGGYHSFRPYNYKQVFSQSAQAGAWGMPQNMPYSQQFYHRYENPTDRGVPPLSTIQPATLGPHPSAMHQPQWNVLRRSPLITAGDDHLQRAASPRSHAPVN